VDAGSPESKRRDFNGGALFLLTATALALAALTIAASTSVAAGVAPWPSRHEVTLGFDKTEPGKLVSHGIPVSRAKSAGAASAKVVYSVLLPRTAAEQRVQVRADVALTRCNSSDQRTGGGAHEGTMHSPCELLRHPYRTSSGDYDPRVAIKAFLGSSPSNLSRGIGSWHVKRCREAVHHCPLQLRTSTGHLPHRHRAWLNFAVAAFDPYARLGRSGRPLDLVELDGDCKHHDYNPDLDGDGNPNDDSVFCEPVLKSAASNTKGELLVIRFGTSQKPSPARSTSDLVNRRIPVRAVGPRSPQAPKPRIILRMRIRHVSPGDVLDVEASFHLRDHPDDGYVFRHEVKGVLFATTDPTALKPHTSAGSPDRWLSGSTGTNCPRHRGCLISKVGAASMPKSTPTSIWVIYVGSAVDDGGVNGALTHVTRGRLDVALDSRGHS
jgi:hypothetical protein